MPLGETEEISNTDSPLPEEKLAADQLVGRVKAYQGDDQ